MSGYDVIGDVHGYADALERLLGAMGYREIDGAYRHPERTAVFLSDLIDRGPGQLRTLQIARAMVDAGSAQIVLGNHEFNAVAWATRNDVGEWCRPHTEKNRHQHAAFLGAVGEDSEQHRSWIEWFESLPMWLDLPGLRVVHACWHEPSMDDLGSAALTREAVTASRGTAIYDAVEILLKGPEIDLDGHSYVDKDGHVRDRARQRWWDPSATTLASAALIPGDATTESGEPFPPLPDDEPVDSIVSNRAVDRPVLYGHYWRSGSTPSIDNARAACLDWSIAGGGHLVAYRWTGESDLADANLVAVR
ncbi:MAG: hypothetical protein H0U92_06175 [Actinobacteria bacterium]|nr:hypothetical protein [Actinomycetota bacterium]